MHWLLKLPVHQQAWYWPLKPEYSVSSIRKLIHSYKPFHTPFHNIYHSPQLSSILSTISLYNIQLHTYPHPSISQIIPNIFKEQLPFTFQFSSVSPTISYMILQYMQLYTSTIMSFFKSIQHSSLMTMTQIMAFCLTPSHNLNQCCSIYIIDLTPGFNGLVKDNCKTRWEKFKFWIWCDLYKRLDVSAHELNPMWRV